MKRAAFRLQPVLERTGARGWFWDTEFMVRAWRSGFVIAEVPGTFTRRRDKVSTVRPVRDSVTSLWHLWQFRRQTAGRP